MLKAVQLVVVVLLVAAYWDATREQPKSPIAREIRRWYQWGWGFRPGPQLVLISLVTSAVVLTILAISALIDATGVVSILQ